MWSTAALSAARERTAAASVGPLVLFAGGFMDGASRSPSLRLFFFAFALL
jgi:hypothetical protein